MEQLRAKFVVVQIQRPSDGSTIVNAEPVATDSEENKAFSDSRPGGYLTLRIEAGKDAQHFFEEGKELYLDISAVE